MEQHRPSDHAETHKEAAGGVSPRRTKSQPAEDSHDQTLEQGMEDTSCAEGLAGAPPVGEQLDQLVDDLHSVFEQVARIEVSLREDPNLAVLHSGLNSGERGRWGARIGPLVEVPGQLLALADRIRRIARQVAPLGDELSEDEEQLARKAADPNTDIAGLLKSLDEAAAEDGHHE